MSTKKFNSTNRFNLVILFAIVFGFNMCVVSCSDDDKDFQADVNLPESLVDGALLVDAGAHDFTFDVKADGPWRVVSQNRFLHVNTPEGNGNGTVTVSVQNNQGQDRKIGTLDIIFPGHEDQNKTVTVEQKYRGDYDDNGASVIDTSNKVYAVGYSYDCTGEYASPNSVKLEIFDTRRMLKVDSIEDITPSQVKMEERTVTGNSIADVSNKLAVEAKVSGGFGAFKAEAEASFGMENSQSSNYEYASTYFDLAVRRSGLNASLEVLKNEYMTDDAYNDINGVGVKTSRGVLKVNYPSTPKDLKRLVENYGTHVILNAGLGGRLRRSLEVDVSKISSSYDIKAFAKASYENAFVSASGSVDENFKKSYEQNKKNLKITMSVLGGDESMAKALGSEAGFNEDNFEAWKNSVTDANMALVSFNRTSLVPLYELVERSATVENGGFDGEARYQALKNYIEGEAIAADFSSNYNCGTVTEFEVPTFSSDYGATLVKDVSLGGQWVAQVCQEFIPIIDRTKRVTVVYPVLSNKPRYNMGFFLGNDTHKPARVCWVGDDVVLEEYGDLDFGQVDKLYLRGASVMALQPKNTDIKKADPIEDEYLVGECWDGYKGNIPYNYPIVKIFNKLWLRQNYAKSQPGQSGKLFNIEGKEVWVEFYPKSTYKTAPPAGWNIPSKDDCERLMKKLEANGFTGAALALMRKYNDGEGLTGFDLMFTGFYLDNGTWERRDQWDYIITSDGGLYTFYTSGNYAGGSFVLNRHCIRLVKNL